MILSEHLIETATRFFYSIPEVSHDLKAFWSNLLKAIALDDLNDSQIEHRELLGASRVFKKLDDVEKELLSMEDVERRQVVSCLMLACEEAKRLKDHPSSRALEKVLKPFASEAVDEMKTQFRQRLDAFLNRQQFFVNGNIRLLSIDFVLKWAVLIGVAAAGLETPVVFVGAEIISICSLIIGWRLSRKDRKANIALLKTHAAASQWKISMRYSRLQYTVLGCYTTCSSIIAFVLVGDGEMFAAIVTFFAVACFYYVMLAVFPLGRMTETDMAAQLQEANELNDIDVDENDEAIVRLETQLQSQTSRLEAYVLESALFGALAFSGFLQIIATNLISFEDLENFATSVFHTLHGLLTAHGDELRHYAGSLNTKTNLFCLVSIETLVCSGLFLAVIASRLRFSKFADAIRTYLSLAQAYNEKEEGIIQQNPAEMASRRFADINSKVNTNIRKAAGEFTNIAPVVSYMEYFRHAGILVFLLVLMTSCLFVSAFLSWTFLLAAIATAIYFNLRTLRKEWKQNLFSFKVFFSKNVWTLFIGSSAIGAIGFALRIILNTNFTDIFLLSSLFAIAMLLYVWLVLMPHHDKKFGDIEDLKAEPWRSSRYKVVKTIYGVSVLPTIFGLSLKITGTYGADEMLLFGLSLMAISSYALGYYLSRPKWLGLLSGMLIGTSAMGTLFTTLHIMGGTEMLRISIGAQILFFVVFFIRRKSFHYILFRAVAGMVLLTLLVSSQTSYLLQLRIMYDHGSTDIRQLATAFYKVPIDFPENDDITVRQAIADCDDYFKTYDVRFRVTSIHWRWLNFFESLTQNALQNGSATTTDSLKLKIADMTSAQLEKISAVFGYEAGDPLLRPKVLLAMKRKKEALTSLEAYMSRIPAKTHTELVKELYAKITALPENDDQ